MAKSSVKKLAGPSKTKPTAKVKAPAKPASKPAAKPSSKLPGKPAPKAPAKPALKAVQAKPQSGKAVPPKVAPKAPPTKAKTPAKVNGKSTASSAKPSASSAKSVADSRKLNGKAILPGKTTGASKAAAAAKSALASTAKVSASKDASKAVVASPAKANGSLSKNAVPARTDGAKPDVAKAGTAVAPAVAAPAVPKRPSLVQGTPAVVHANAAATKAHNAKLAKHVAASLGKTIVTPKPIVPKPAPTPAMVVQMAPPRPAIPSSEKKAKNPHFSDRDLEFFREELLKKRREVLGDMHGMEREALRENTTDLSTLPMHMADQGTDAYEQEFTLTLVEKDRTLLRDINDALAKIQNGSYGICEATALPISRARLEAVPWSRYSIEHQRALERRQMPFRR